MDTSDSSQTNKEYIIGMLFLFVIALLVAIILAYIENDFIHAVFARNTFWITLLTLASVNGCLRANEAVVLRIGTESVEQWIQLALSSTIVYFVCLILYMPVLIITILGWLFGG